MCGRYNITADPADLLRVFDALDRLDPFEPRYNIAPSEPPLPAGSNRKAPRRMTSVAIVRQDSDAMAGDMAIWPLIPIWAKGEVPRYSTANARSETMHEKNAFRHAWRQGQRCLVVATGFYEWQDVGGRTKRPWSIAPENETFFAFGGLWEMSNDALSCTIVTMPANERMREIHNAGANRHRMPLILQGDARLVWLRGTEDEARACIVPYPADEMHTYPVSTAINNPNVDSPALLEPLAG